MTEHYSQTVEMEVLPKTKAMQWIGIGLVLFSMGFLMLTIFYKWYFVFAFIIILVIGIVYIHFYNVTAKEYIYEFSPKRLTIAKKDLVGRTRRLISLVFDDVESCSLLEGLGEEGDIIACKSVHDCGVYQITYVCNNKRQRLLFAPDTYMLALLKEILSNRYQDYRQEYTEE